MNVENFRLLVNNTPVKFVKSPNVDDLLTQTLFVIIHYTDGASLDSAVNWLANPASQVSAHLVIGRNGDVVQLVPFNYCAWHAGVSQWKGYTGLNHYSIGIELDNAGMMKPSGNQWISSFGKLYSNSEVLVAAHKSSPNAIYGWQKYTDIQLKTAAEVVAALVRAYGIQEILGHDDIAPNRKKDPGPAFPIDQFRLDVAALVAAAGPADNTGDPTNGGPVPTEDPTKKTVIHYKVEDLDHGLTAEYDLDTVLKPVSLLPVPFVPGSGTGADTHQNDSGAAAAVMLLQAYLAISMTPDEFYTKFSISADPILSIDQLRNAMGSLGLLTDLRATITPQDLFTSLTAGKPVIVTMNDKSPGTSHYGVVVGMDIKNIYIHDALQTKDADGNAHAYPIDLFTTAGAGISAIIPIAGIGSRLTRRLKVAISAVNVRSGPALDKNVVQVLKKDAVVEIVHETNGWGEILNTGWVFLANMTAA